MMKHLCEIRKTLSLILLAFCLTAAVSAQSQDITTTGCETATDCDGITYPTVNLNGICWMSKNMAAELCVSIGNVYTYLNAQYPDSASNVAAYGRLYDEAAVLQDSALDANGNLKSICPEGWFLPTTAHFEYLKSHYTDYELRSATGWINVAGDNSSGFSWVPSGIRNGTTNRFEDLLSGGYLWAVEMTTGTPKLTIYELPCHCDQFLQIENTTGICASIRCVKGDVLEPEPDPEPFTCGSSKMKDASGNKYETVQIGQQCWTKTNLRTIKFRNGNTIPEDVDPEQSASASFSRASSADVLPDFPTYTDSTFGFYYNWYAATDTGDSKLCPEGWHVSNEEDWTILDNYLKTYDYCGSHPTYIAKALADSLLWAPYSSDCSVGKDPENNNASGFSAVPAGYLSYGEQYPMYAEVLANFWIAKPCDDNHNPNYYAVSRYYAELLLSEDKPKSALLSVRCVSDAEYQAIVKPTVTTDSATRLTPTSARLYGTVTNPDNVAITEMGFEWKENGGSEYTSTPVDGMDLTTTIGSLAPNTKYFYRAYITYDNKTLYGAELSFTTPVVSVTTDSANNVTLTAATIYGTVINPNDVPLTAKGFLWKKSHGVYEYDTVKFTGGNAMTHTFSDLTPNTKYDYKTFIKYDNKTVYGEQRSFTTPNHPEVSCGTMTDADGNLYQTVKVGNQCWTKTNLRTTRYRKGSTISNQIGTTTPAYYRLSAWDKANDSIVGLTTAPDSIFGFYYNGYAAVRDSLCPVGWHVPDTNDWKDFIGYLKSRPEYWCDNDNSNLAKAVASRNYWFNVETPPITYTINHDAVSRPCSPQYQGPDYLNDASYFSAIPAGAWYDNLGGNADTTSGLGGREFDPGKDAHFWSSSPQPNSDSTGYFFRLGIITYDVVALAYDALKYGRSVRCLRDEPVSEAQTFSDETRFFGYFARRLRDSE